MSVYVECANEETGKKNTGATEQCLEGVLIKTAVALPGFKFDSIEDAKDLEKWNDAVAAKQLWPLYEVEEFTPANTEDTFFEGRSRQYTTSVGKKVSTYTSMLGLCSHSALKSFNGAEMKLFEFTEDRAIKAVISADKTVTGQTVTLKIAKRLDPTADRPASTLVTISYADYNELEDNGAILRPTWGPSELYGIFDVSLRQVSATATNIKLKAVDGCAGGNETLDSLTLANFVVKNAAGVVQTVTFTAADSDGVYTLTGTAFATGYTVSLNGVVTIVGMSYESPEPLKITVTP